MFWKEKSKIPRSSFKWKYSWYFPHSISTRSLRKSSMFTTAIEKWCCWKFLVGTHRLFRCFQNQHLGLFIITVRPVFTQRRSVARRVAAGYFLGEGGRSTDFQVISAHSQKKIHRFSFLLPMLQVRSNFFSRELDVCKLLPDNKR